MEGDFFQCYVYRLNMMLLLNVIKWILYLEKLYSLHPPSSINPKTTLLIALAFDFEIDTHKEAK